MTTRRQRERVIRCNQCGAWRPERGQCTTCAMGVIPDQLLIWGDPWAVDDYVDAWVDDTLGESDR